MIRPVMPWAKRRVGPKRAQAAEPNAFEARSSIEYPIQLGRRTAEGSTGENDQMRRSFSGQQTMTENRADRRRRGRAWLAVAMLASLAAVVPVAGCNGPFFVCQGKSSCPTTPGSGGTGTGTTPTNTGDFAYVANSSAGNTYLSEFEIASGTLNSVGTIDVGYIPVALAVAPSNSFLYVATTPGFTSPGIYLYTIGSTGALTAANGGNALATDTVAAMAISPDGNWLYTVNSDGLTMAEYAVNTTTGGLTLSGEVTLPGTTCSLTTATPVSQSCSVTVAPSGAYVVASLGPSGDWVYPYSSSAGITQIGEQTISSGYSISNPVGNFSTALDTNNYAYIAQTSSVSTYLVQTGGITPENTLQFAAGTVPRSLTLSKNYNYLYTADEGTGAISGYGISGNAALTEISGSPFTAPPNVSAIGIDNTGSYLVAVGYSASAGVELYSMGSSGALTKVSAAGSGTSTLYPALVAMTH